MTHTPLPIRNTPITIGYISQHAYDGIGLELLTGVSRAAVDLGVHLICVVGGSTLTNREVNLAEITAIKLLNSNRIDGLVSWASSLRYYMDIAELEDFHRRFLPLPMVSIGMPMNDVHSVLMDTRQGVREVLNHLIQDHGLRRIAFIQGSKGHYYSNERFSAYLEALSENGIPFDEALVAATADFNQKEALRALRVLLDERKLQPQKDIEAIVTVTDILSIPIIKELTDRGIKVPGDIAVAGFNNRPESFSCSPPLTTVGTDFAVHGYRAVEALIKIIQGQPVQTPILMPTQLVIRQSCGCFESPVMNARAFPEPMPEPVHYPPVPLEVCLRTERHGIIAAIRRCLEKAPIPLESHEAELLLDSLTGQLHDLAPDQFLKNLEGCLTRWKNAEANLLAWQDVISELRRFFLPRLTDPKQFQRAEDLWHQARVLINIKAENSESSRSKSSSHANQLAQVGGLFNSSLDLAELVNIIERELPKLGIPGCYLALFDDSAVPPRTARLILAFNRNGRIRLGPDGYLFPSHQLVPCEILPTDRPVALVVESCYYKDHQLGFAAFEMGPLDGALYEILRTSFSSALYGALIMQERVKAEQDRERLLKALEIKNRELVEKNAANKRVNEQLQTAIAQANRANNAKSEFLTNISHEIRTPLNCILGFAEVAATIDNLQEYQYYQNLIMDESEKLLELINQLLDISKIEAGKLKLLTERFDFYKLMESLTSSFAVSAKNKGLTFELQASDAIPRFLKGDSLRLRQVLVNLIGNAIKFTNRGGVRVLAEVKSKTAATVILFFQIIDTGIGIPEDHLHAIFKTFVQVESSNTRKYGGTGLGTAISKQLVELMNGTIGVTSEEGKGSNFWFTVTMKPAPGLPLPGNENEAAPEAFPEPEKPLSVLAAEDYPTNQRLISTHLHDLNCRGIIAENGRQAVEAFQKQHFDLVLMDIQMPEMDGYEAARQIRALPGGGELPIIAMTANAFESEINKCYEAGINDVIIKPFRKSVLQAKISYWATGRRGGTEPAGPALDQAATPTVQTVAPPLDFERNLEDFGGDYELTVQIIAEFIQNVRSQIAPIQQALSERQAERIWREAHSIKGGALNLSAGLLAEAAVALEQSGKANDFTRCASALAQLKNELSRLESFFITYIKG